MSLSGDKPHLAVSGPTAATPHRAVGSGRVTWTGSMGTERSTASSSSQGRLQQNHSRIYIVTRSLGRSRATSTRRGTTVP